MRKSFSIAASFAFKQQQVRQHRRYPFTTFSMSHPNSSHSKRILDEQFQRLQSNKTELLILDGGTGEELFRRGVPDDRNIWSATAVVNPEYHLILEEVHRSFLKAGSQAITTNSYGIIPGVGFKPDEITTHVATSGRIALESTYDKNDGPDKGMKRTALVLGSLGPLIESYRPDLIMDHDSGVSAYTPMAISLSPNVDSFLAETMSCFEESSQVVEAISGLSPDHKKPVMVSYTLQSDGTLRDGEDVISCIRRLLKLTGSHDVRLLAILFNCAQPEAITIALERIHADEHLRLSLTERKVVLGAYANRLTPVPSGWTMEDSNESQPFRTDLLPSQYYSEFVSKWVNDLDVQIVGGCCGITPEHISYLSEHLSVNEN